MARAALVTLALAVCATGEHYGGGAMPQYGAADYEHEYPARSLDAPAPLDYKYREELHDAERAAKFTEDADRWRKLPSRLQRKPAREDAEEELELENRALEAEARSGRRRRKRRGRAHRDEPRRRSLPPPPAGNSRRDHYPDGIDYQDDRNKYFEDHDRIPAREMTGKILGRKPRQRVFAPPPPSLVKETVSEKTPDDFLLDEEEEKMSRPLKEEVKDDSEYSSGEEREPLAGHNLAGSVGRDPKGSAGRVRATLPSIEPEPVAERDDAMRDWRQPKVAGSYPEYNDYQRSMTNVENMKNKLPTLLRRPTPTTTQRLRKLFSAGRVRPWPGRRAGQLAVIPLEESVPTFTALFSTASSVKPPTTTPVGPATELSAASSTTTTVAAATLSPADNATIVTIYAPVAFVPALNESELSMADKSRLSIMKKAQMKESPGRGATRKPPVLLHVTTKQVPTVVMVAPAFGTADPWLRAREVAGDSPATLEKVKRLMRQKLVSSAKSIRDLTDNWDDTICDYIDVGMLESLSDEAGSPRASLLAAVCSLCLLLVMNS